MNRLKKDFVRWMALLMLLSAGGMFISCQSDESPNDSVPCLATISEETPDESTEPSAKETGEVRENPTKTDDDETTSQTAEPVTEPMEETAAGSTSADRELPRIPLH